MAKIKNGALGTYQGKLGPLIFYKIYDIECARTRPAHFKDAKSEAQLIQRQKVVIINPFCQCFGTLFRITLSHVSTKRSAYHTALSLNLRHAISITEEPSVCLDLSKAILSEGPLPLPEKATVSYEENSYHFTWNCTTGNAYDTLILIAYHPEMGRSDFWVTGTPRKQQSQSWTPNLPSGELHFWMAFRSKDEQVLSDSLYLGSGI